MQAKKPAFCFLYAVSYSIAFSLRLKMCPPQIGLKWKHTIAWLSKKVAHFKWDKQFHGHFWRTYFLFLAACMGINGPYLCCFSGKLSANGP